MRFHLSEEQDQFQGSLRGTLDDHARARRDAFEPDRPWPSALWTDLMRLGVGGVMVAPKFGGSGLCLLDAALALEVIGEHAGPGAFMAQILSAIALGAGEQTDQTAAWLAGVASGEIVASVALPAPWRETTKALQATSDAVTGATGLILASTQVDLLVIALPDGDLGVVQAASDAVSVQTVAGSDPTRPLAGFVFDKAPLTRLHVGVGDVDRLSDAASILLAADALGGAGRCMSMAVEYAKTREQFGRPIGGFQALKHQLASMAVEVEPGRGLVWYAAHAWDTGAQDAPRVASLVKAHMADRFVAVTRAAVEAHGGIGYTWEYDLHIWFRRALFDAAYGGAPAWHRERAARLAGW